MYIPDRSARKPSASSMHGESAGVSPPVARPDFFMATLQPFIADLNQQILFYSTHMRRNKTEEAITRSNKTLLEQDPNGDKGHKTLLLRNKLSLSNMNGLHLSERCGIFFLHEFANFRGGDDLVS